MRVGLDVGGTKTDAVAVDSAGTIVARVRLATGWGADAVVRTVLAAVDSLSTQVGRSRSSRSASASRGRSSPARRASCTP